MKCSSGYSFSLFGTIYTYSTRLFDGRLDEFVYIVLSALDLTCCAYLASQCRQMERHIEKRKDDYIMSGDDTSTPSRLHRPPNRRPWGVAEKELANLDAKDDSE